jgi:hypothetical protein
MLLVFPHWVHYTDWMNPRELILLSPYRLPTQNTLYLGDDDVAAFLNGYSALWHPAALQGAGGPPRIGSPYDYEQPQPHHVYAVPTNPPLLLPDDWDQRVESAGAVAFRATPNRAETLANLRNALRGSGAGDAGRGAGSAGRGAEDLPAPNTEPNASDPVRRAQRPAPCANWLDLEPERYAPFFGIGFGYLHVEGLFEAMSHENLLSTPELWHEVQQALTALSDSDQAAFRQPLQLAANRLLSAREVLYPVTIHVVDLCLLQGNFQDMPWPAAFDKGLPFSLVACASLLERLQREQPERFAALRERVSGEVVEVCGGTYLEREDALLPLESQLWNLIKGLAVHEHLLGQPVRVHARQRFGFHPQTPLLLQHLGVSRTLLLSFDESVLPAHRATVVNWPSQDGKQVEAFARTPHPGESAQTYFHLTYHLHRTIMQDQAATVPLLHRAKAAAPWYEDWLELSRFAPVLGRWTTLSGYLNEVLSGEYTSAAEADEFHDDYLVERTPAAGGEADLGGAPAMTPAPPPGPWKTDQPISGFAIQLRARRRLDTAWAMLALYRGLGGRPDSDLESFLARLGQLEEHLETQVPIPVEDLVAAQQEAAQTLAQRLVARGANQPGYLVLNPCSYKRRVVLELPDLKYLLPLNDPVKACQVDGSLGRVVLEVPALGFAWVPRHGVPGTAAPARRMRLADEKMVRNEFFEAEIDTATGGLKTIRDHRTRANRLGQQLVYNPGSTMRATQVQVTSTGPALGEIVTEGVLLDAQGQELATFRQRFQAWLGRPMLDLRLEIQPRQGPRGYPWHAYYGARFAWRDERALLLRGVNGIGYVTSHTRPETPDFLELRLGQQNTVLFPGGLPFHQRQGGRMLDVMLLVEGETCQTFELGIGVDRPQPMQTAQGMATPVPVVATEQGPPHVGATGWLFHLDAPNLLLTSLRPAPDGSDAVVARLLECGGHAGPAEFRCVRDPKRAILLDGRSNPLFDAATQGDAALLDAGRYDLLQVRVEFS